MNGDAQTSRIAASTLSYADHVRDGLVEARAGEARQVLDVGVAAHEDAVARVPAEALLEIRAQLDLERRARIDVLDPVAQAIEERDDQLLLLVARARGRSLRSAPSSTSTPTGRPARSAGRARGGRRRTGSRSRRGRSRRTRTCSSPRFDPFGPATRPESQARICESGMKSVDVEIQALEVEVDRRRPSRSSARRRRPRSSAIRRARAGRHRRGSPRAPPSCRSPFSTRASCDGRSPRSGCRDCARAAGGARATSPRRASGCRRPGARSGVVSGSR